MSKAGHDLPSVGGVLSHDPPTNDVTRTAPRVDACGVRGHVKSERLTTIMLTCLLLISAGESTMNESCLLIYAPVDDAFGSTLYRSIQHVRLDQCSLHLSHLEPTSIGTHERYFSPFSVFHESDSVNCRKRLASCHQPSFERTILLQAWTD